MIVVLFFSNATDAAARFDSNEVASRSFSSTVDESKVFSELSGLARLIGPLLSPGLVCGVRSLLWLLAAIGFF